MVRYLCLLTVLIFSTCNPLSREDFLSGKFGDIDANTPELIYPAQDARLSPAAASKLTFTWARKAGVGDYTLEIASDKTFTNILKTAAVRNPEYSVDAELAQKLSDDDFFWRVKSRESGFSAGQKFHVENPDYIFVDVNTQATGKAGNKTQPLTSINEAVLLALSSKNLFEPPKVREIRVAQGTYDTEIITLLSGIRILGGYNAATWQQTPAVTKSILRAPVASSIAVSFVGSQNTVLNGVEVQNNNTANGATGILVQNADNVEISDSAIRGGGGLDPKGIQILSSGKVTIRNSTVTGGLPATGSSYGLYAQFVSDLLIDSTTIRPAVGEVTLGPVAVYLSFSYADIERSVIYGGNNSDTSRTNKAVYIEYSTAKLNGNTIYSADPDSNDATIQANSIAIELATGAPWDDVSFKGNQAILITNNLIVSTYARITADGILVSGTSGSCGLRRILAVNNTFILRNNAASTQNQSALNLNDANRCWEIRNNLIFAEAQGSGYSQGIRDTSGANPLLRNNLIAGALTAQYYRSGNINDNGDFNLDSELDPISTASVSGNRTTNQAGAALFVAPASSDYHLKTGSAALGIGENLYGISTYGPLNDDRDLLARPSSGAWTSGSHK